MRKRNTPFSGSCVPASAAMTAVVPAGTRTTASYVSRTPGLSMQGTQLRAWIDWDWVNRNGCLPDVVCRGSSHWSAVACGLVRYAMRTCPGRGWGSVMRRRWPSRFTAGSSANASGFPAASVTDSMVRSRVSRSSVAACASPCGYSSEWSARPRMVLSLEAHRQVERHVRGADHLRVREAVRIGGGQGGGQDQGQGRHGDLHPES